MLITIWLWAITHYHLVTVDWFPRDHTYGVSLGTNDTYASIELIGRHLVASVQHCAGDICKGA